MMTARKRLLITGIHGQVVQSLMERGGHHPDLEFLAVGRPELNLALPDTIRAAVTRLNPDLIVSAAAYTAVDQAENEEGLASIINSVAAGALAQTARELRIPIIHLSTDYVFDGSKSSAYVETDPVRPISAYGRTKLAGEAAVVSATDNHAILRTAWVYSPVGKNFLRTMLRLAESRDTLGVVADQFGTPTCALDIADAIVAIARNMLETDDQNLRGIFHMTNEGKATWADFAEEIFSASALLGGPIAEVRRIRTTDYPTPARRPTNSQLDCSKLASVHGIVLPEWTYSTKMVVARILQPPPASS